MVSPESNLRANGALTGPHRPLYNPLRVFLPIGAVLFIVGAVKLVYDVFTVENLSESAVLGILGAIMIWTFGLLADMISRLNLRR